MGMMAIRRALLAQQGGGILPGIYRQLEWIGSDGNQYIDTSYVPVQGDEFNVSFIQTGNGSTFRALFCAGTGTYQSVVLLPQNVGSGGGFIRYFSSGSKQFTFAYGSDLLNITIDKDGVLSVDNHYLATCAFENDLDGDNAYIRIFRRANGNNPMSGKLYGFTVTNNGVDKLKLIPCLRISDSKPGVYDTVSESFYANAGTGDFTIPT